MAKGYIIYNPLAVNGTAAEVAEKIKAARDGQCRCIDITTVEDFSELIGKMEAEDYLVIAGGDGTLNRFANATEGIEIPQEIFYIPVGSGNDFAKDVGEDGAQEPVNITRYMKNLPVVEVKGKTYRFLNGVGFGIDGYCCQVGDEQKAKNPGKQVNYTGIAIKGLLFHFAPRNAKVTVDGKEYTYKKVWIAPTMHGRYYGGGMVATPAQDRCNEDGTLSLMMFHGAGRIPTLCVFPSIFKGEHVKHTKRVAVHSGHEITVEFDSPAPLQIDGETILDVVSYTAKGAAR